MRTILILSLIVLAGCANVMNANDKQITVRAGTAAASLNKAQEKADAHCAQFDKTAVYSNQISFNTHVYRCE